MPSRLWDVQDALVTLFGGISGLSVFDGPMSRTTPPKQFLLVGSDGGETGTGQGSDDGAIAERTAAGMGAGREENGEITCSAWAWSGGTDFAPLRADAKAIVDAADALVRADPTLGGAIDVLLTTIEDLRLRQTQTSKGAFVRAAFTVSYRALPT